MSIQEQLLRIGTGIRRPINPVPRPTTEEVYREAEKEGMAVQRARKGNIRTTSK